MLTSPIGARYILLVVQAIQSMSVAILAQIIQISEIETQEVNDRCYKSIGYLDLFFVCPEPIEAGK